MKIKRAGEVFRIPKIIYTLIFIFLLGITIGWLGNFYFINQIKLARQIDPNNDNLNNFTVLGSVFMTVLDPNKKFFISICPTALDPNCMFTKF